MSLSLTPSKRQNSHDSDELNGKKFQKTSKFDAPKEPTKSNSGGDVFRVLCPSSKIESIVGQEENIMSQIREETGAMVRIDGPIPGCDERVIFIMGPDKEAAQNSNEQSNNNGCESKSTKDQVNSEDHNDNVNGNDTVNTNDNVTEQEALSIAGDAQSDKGSSVQRALLLVLEKFVQGENQAEVANAESNGLATITFRLLVLSSQVGCLLGRGGSIIKQMATESGAQIRVVPKDKLPQCASSSDDIVQITGGGDAVKKAIKSVSKQIIESSNGEPDILPSTSSRPALHSRGHPASRSEAFSTRPLPFRGAPFGSGFREDNIHPNIPLFFPRPPENIMPRDIITFRFLCPDDRVRGIIGKGGAIIKILMNETGCEIKVLEGFSVGEERVIAVSGPAHPEDKISPVQDAMLRVLHRIAKTTLNSKEKGVKTKILVHPNQIGCLLGKGGSIITAMQGVTGAFIRILSKDELPASTSDDFQVIQINGELEGVQEAVLQITTRLQHHFFRDAFPDRAPPFTSFMGRHELSPKFVPSLRNFDSVGALPFRGGLHPHDDHPPFTRDVNRHGVSERPWPPQSLIEGGRPHHRQISGFGGGNQQAIITNTVVEVVVPSSVIPSICGDGNGCLRQIRQISEAKIAIEEPRPGAPETLIIISGTPEQTHAAQSLIQAFVMLENGPSR